MTAFKDWLTGLTNKATPAAADELHLRDAAGNVSVKTTIAAIVAQAAAKPDLNIQRAMQNGGF